MKKVNTYLLFISIICLLFVIDCKEVTEYKEKHQINFQQYDSLQKLTQNRQKSFKFSTIQDIQKNTYKTIQIGKQIWMAENLKSTLYNDSSLIGVKWNIVQDAQCAYFNQKDSIQKYGLLYNWYAVETQKLCPKGWHVPTIAEWDTLILYLTSNFYGYEGNKADIAKALATKTDWKFGDVPGFIGFEPNLNNASGFSALPAGSRLPDGKNVHLGEYTSWWTANAIDEQDAQYVFLFYDYAILSQSKHSKQMGMSVRCLKNSK